MQIAIDGPAGAGKSTIAKKIAEAFGIIYLDTGAMYRCIAHSILMQGDNFNDIEKIIKLTEEAVIKFQGDHVFCNGADVTEAIRMPLVSLHTSDVACIKEVRKLLVEQQQKIALDQSVIMDGRDIGSVVLPRADYKFFLDADITERALRRKKELDARGIEKSLESIKQEIEKRDDNDRNRCEGPLVQVEDAILVDTTGKSIEEVCDVIKNHISGV
ncbi:(d)CMP kinase [Acetobacterium sp.]|uniref:(d)CMP kinase n=1 Tax=Acetobacterium sp. TaxID=1872094 RepID=UPI002F42A1D6